MATPENTRVAAGQNLSWVVVSLLGVLVLLVPLYDIWDDLTNFSWTLTETLLENALLVALALGLVYGGIWLGQRDWEPKYIWTVTKWNLSIVGGIALLYALVMALQIHVLGTLKPWILALDGLLFVAVTAFGVGIYNARRQRSHDELQRREQELRTMYDVIADPTTTFEEKVDGLIGVGRELFDAEHGSFARIDDDGTYHLEVVQSEDIETGDALPLAQTYCKRTVDESQTIQFETEPLDREETDGDADAGFQMYVGTPVHAHDTLYGTLCFLSHEQKPFDDWELTLVELMGNWVGYELDRKRLLQDRQQRLREQEAKFEEFVTSVDNYAIFTLDSDGNVTSWNDGAEQIKGYTQSEIVGEHIKVFYPEERSSEGVPETLLSEAKATGLAHDEGWRVRKDGSRFWADVTIAARYDDNGDHTGYTKVVQDMTEQREYERTIEHERERLEFMNRIIRHNILNGLNLVRARSQIIEAEIPSDSDAKSHLDTIQDRVDDLSSLVQTMRTFMDAVVSESAHETEPVALRPVLEQKIALAVETYHEAEFETHDLPADSVEIVGDELVGEVIENIISNAIVHNDEETPRVEVWTTETTLDVDVDPETGEILPDRRVERPRETAIAEETRQAIEVHIADNGPGIPDDQKEAVLEKGVSELKTPGNGFGLYLVREMMHAYGGRIDIDDNDEYDDGTVVTMAFPLAK